MDVVEGAGDILVGDVLDLRLEGRENDIWKYALVSSDGVVVMASYLECLGRVIYRV